MLARRLAGHNWAFALFTSLLSMIFVLIILLSGLGGHVPAKYLTIDTSQLSVSPKLATSSFLQDLSTVSGKDYVGSASTAAGLGLSPTYSIALLTSCGEGDGSASCSRPHVGYQFDPDTQLKLSSTSTPESTTSGYASQLQTYRRVSAFVAVSYILSVWFTITSCICVVLSRVLPRINPVARITTVLTTLLLLPSAIASAVASASLKRAFNQSLLPLGLATRASSSALGLAFAAALLSLLASLALALPVLAPTSPRPTARAFDDKDVFVDAGAGAGADVESIASFDKRAAPRSNALKRMPTPWHRHKYARVTAAAQQPPASRPGSAGSTSSDREHLVGATDEPSFPMRPPQQQRQKQEFGSRSRDRSPFDGVETAYEPHGWWN